MLKTLDDLKKTREMWADEEIKKHKQRKIDAAKDPDPAYDTTGSETDDTEGAKSDWDHLKDVAKIKFPAHLAARYDITPLQRTVCVAYSLGWTVPKIAKATSKGEDTIRRWLRDDIALEFIAAFNYHTGTKDSKELIDREQYNAIEVLRDIRDNPTVTASTRADIAKWFYEQKHGKPKEHREVTGVNVRELTEQLAKLAAEKAAKSSVPDFDETDRVAESVGILPKFGSS